MARIRTIRPEAAIYNGQAVDFVRVVGPADGPAFSDATPQMIVRYQGNELFFYANEVSLSEEEQDAARDTLDDAHEKHEKAQAAGERNAKNKKKLLKTQAEADPEETAAPAGDGIAAHQGVSAAEIEAGRNPQNRVPSSPPPASNPGTAPAGSPQQEPGEHREGRTPLDQLPGGTTREYADAHPPSAPDNPKPLTPSQAKAADKAADEDKAPAKKR